MARSFQALHDAVCRLGSTQIRNVATMGGNICNASPSADTACPLLVFDAEAVIAGPGGERRVALDDFFVGTGQDRPSRRRDPERVSACRVSAATRARLT